MSEPMTAQEVARYVVAEAVWAPSVHNTQPWRFTVGSEQAASRSACTPTPNAGWPSPTRTAAS